MIRALTACCALLLFGCGSSDREEFNRVQSSVERARNVSSNRLPEMRAAAEDIAAVSVEHPKALAARNACAKAYADRALLHQTLQDADDALAKVPRDTGVEVAVREKVLIAKDLQERLPVEMDLCTQRLGELWSGR